ncbi:hypothetical protein AAF712_004399 [Marasmius tenuissimus]|uniref:Uncharacterized protein n=1 Tax=Marasmius tenuissimus TaxID=585030 RepID=A0ABR3A4W7_9AGAR
MNLRKNSVQLQSKYAVTYSRLFQGYSPAQISPNEDPSKFYTNLLGLNINRDFLVAELTKMPKEACLGNLKPIFNTLFLTFLEHARSETDTAKRGNAFETLTVLTRCILAKNLSGWEVMEIFAGGTGKSDELFMLFTGVIEETLADPSTPEHVQHQALQLALVFMCGVGQLSPGAYFLRKDLFPSLVSFMKAPETERYTFEACLLLAILANFHKSDAAKLNPYLQRIKDTDDAELMRKIYWAANFALYTAVRWVAKPTSERLVSVLTSLPHRAYQEIHNDEPEPTFTTTLGSFLASMRPDRALASTPIDPPRELFKDQ